MNDFFVLKIIYIKNSSIELNYGNGEYAKVVKDSLEVDEELKPELIERKFEVQGNILKVYVFGFKTTK